MAKNKTINIEGSEITIIPNEKDYYISLTDMAKSQMQEAIIIKWLSLKSTIEYIGEWELLYNPDFNCTEFGTIKNESGSNGFVLSVKQWIEKTNAVLIRQGLPQSERLIQLNSIAITQMKSLINNSNLKKLK
ncbi:MAG: KilA-N domain-containing protein [Bacteroidales bacterium]|jgi:hypothetical protein|nr:KilA-N domain-containing protein [Bacteroidales bacterium]